MEGKFEWDRYWERQTDISLAQNIAGGEWCDLMERLLTGMNSNRPLKMLKGEDRSGSMAFWLLKDHGGINSPEPFWTYPIMAYARSGN